MYKSNTVLVIDDDEGICDAVTDILSEVGIQVITADEGQRGIETYKLHQEQIGVVLLDKSLPGMDGHEVLLELRKLAPTLPIIFSSGWGTSSAAGTDQNLTFLNKPFSFDDLVNKVEAVLQRSTP